MSSLVIVAIPSPDDIVWKLSSEEVPHLTLLYLGDTGSGQNVGQIATYLEHAASRSLARFGLDVDRRGTLGEDNADVLFFSKSKWSGFETMADFRHFLLQDPSIRSAYDAVEQHPEYIPHLTMGYPDDPAKKDDRDYPGIHYVSFDRIAIWFDEYAGLEFALNSYDWDMEVVMGAIEEGQAAVEDILGLKHYGVKGMKWGKSKVSDLNTRRKASVAKSQAKASAEKAAKKPKSGDAVAAKEAAQKLKKKGVDSLSNQELQALTTRMNLEQQVSRLQANQPKSGADAVKAFLAEAGKEQVIAYAKKPENQVKIGQAFGELMTKKK